jgi:hypothetical protein
MTFRKRVVQVSSLVMNKAYPINSAERVGDNLLICFLNLPD